MPNCNAVIQQTTMEQNLESINGKIFAKELSHLKSNFIRGLSVTLPELLGTKVSLSTEEYITLDKKFHSSFSVLWRIALTPILFGRTWMLFFVDMFVPIVLILSGLVSPIVVFLFFIAYNCIIQFDMLHRGDYVFRYWIYRRKLIHLCDDKIIETTIREMKI